MFQYAPVVYINLALVAGILVNRTGLPNGWIVAMVLVSIILLWLPLGKRWFGWFILSAVFSLGLGLARWHEINNETEFLELSRFNDTRVSARGIVKDMTVTQTGKYRYRVCLISMSDDSVGVKRPGGAYIYATDSLSAIAGDTITVLGKWRPYPAATNPGQFDVQSYYRTKGIYGMLLPADESSLTIRQGQGLSLARMIYTARQGIKSFLNRSLDGTSAGLLNALLLGDRSALDPELLQRFRSIGVVHVLAVSGLHVGYILIILSILMSVLRVPWGYDRMGIILGLFLFSALTGFTPSVMRASLMAALYVLAPVLNRTANPWNILSTASFVILLVQPQQLFQTGFILSFSAVSSIIFFYNEINRILPEPLQLERIKSPVVKYIWALFLVSFSAQIGTLPIIIYLFHNLPLVGILANIIIVPLIGALVASGILFLLVSSIPVLGFGIQNAIWLLSRLVTGLSNVFNQFPWANVTVHRFTVWEFTLYLLGLIILVLLMRRKIRWATMVVLVAGTLLVWRWALLPVGMEIYFLDVGQGDCAIVRWPNGKIMVVDAGSRYRHRDMGRDIVLPALQFLGCNRISWLVLTHPHNDHLGGMKTLLYTIPVDTVLAFRSDYQSWTYQSTLAAVDSLQIYLRYPQPGDYIIPARQSRVTILWPPGKHEEFSLNNSSLVLWLEYDGTTCLLTGDLEKEGEAGLMNLSFNIKSDILKIGHHGSATSTSVEFLTRVDPDFAVISVAEINKFGHPSPMTLKKLEHYSVRTFRTDRDGAVKFALTGKRIRIETWK